MVNQYNTVMTSRDAITTEDYNNLYNSMSETYNQLDGAQAKIDNATILHNNALSTNYDIVNKSNILNNGIPTFKASTEYLPMITDSRVDPVTTKTTTVLKPSSVVDLPSMYGQVIQSGLSDSELTSHVTALMREGIQDGGLPTAIDYMKTVANLAADPTYGPVYAQQLAPVVAKATDTLLTSYITKNIDTIKTAVNDLVNPSGGFLGMGKNQPGATNSTTLANWTTKYSGTIDKDILSALSMAVQAYMTQSSAFQQNPGTIFTSSFGDATGNVSKLTSDDLSKIVASLVSQTWSASMDPANYTSQVQ
jgi:hypothetical protein